MPMTFYARSPLGLQQNISLRTYQFKWTLGKWLIYIPCPDFLARFILWITKPYYERREEEVRKVSRQISKIFEREVDKEVRKMFGFSYPPILPKPLTMEIMQEAIDRMPKTPKTPFNEILCENYEKTMKYLGAEETKTITGIGSIMGINVVERRYMPHGTVMLVNDPHEFGKLPQVVGIFNINEKKPGEE